MIKTENIFRTVTQTVKGMCTTLLVIVRNIFFVSRQC